MDLPIDQLANDAAYAISDLLDEVGLEAFNALPALEKVISRYLHADCDDFALVLHEVTGWPIVGVVGRCGPLHRLNQAPDGRLVDAAGWVTSADLARRYHTPVSLIPPNGRSLSRSVLDDQDNEGRLLVLAAMLHLRTEPFAGELRDRLLQHGQALLARSPEDHIPTQGPDLADVDGATPETSSSDMPRY